MSSYFKVHVLNDDGLQKAKRVQLVFQQLENELRQIWGDTANRETALALTKLEEASFFSKKAVAMKPENQKIDYPLGEPTTN